MLSTIPILPEILGTTGFKPTDKVWYPLLQPSIMDATLIIPGEVPTVTSILFINELPVQSDGSTHEYDVALSTPVIE